MTSPLVVFSCVVPLSAAQQEVVRRAWPVLDEIYAGAPAARDDPLAFPEHALRPGMDPAAVALARHLHAAVGSVPDALADHEDMAGGGRQSRFGGYSATAWSTSGAGTCTAAMPAACCSRRIQRMRP